MVRIRHARRDVEHHDRRHDAGVSVTSALARRGTYRRCGAHTQWLTCAFGAGYLLAWTLFSVVAATVQLGLRRASLMSEDMRIHSAIAGGVLLIVAGVDQWLPVKGACLTHCGSPFTFLTHEWREGAGGASVMGSRHDSTVSACCWR